MVTTQKVQNGRTAMKAMIGEWVVRLGSALVIPLGAMVILMWADVRQLKAQDIPHQKSHTEISAFMGKGDRWTREDALGQKAQLQDWSEGRFITQVQYGHLMEKLNDLAADLKEVKGLVKQKGN